MDATADRLPPGVAPGPRGLPWLGSLLEMKRAGQLPMLVRAWRRYGDLVRFRMGPKTLYLVSHPDHIRHVLMTNRDNYCKGFGNEKLKALVGMGLLTSEGRLWQQQRRLIQPAFTAAAVGHYAPAITESTSTMIDRWRIHAATDTPVEISGEMLHLAMQIIGKTMFSVDVEQDADRIAHALDYAFSFIIARTLTAVDVPLFVPTPANRRFHHALHILDSFIYGMIEERRRLGDHKPDLLSTLLQAHDAASGMRMSKRQLRDEVLTIFFAGHEATSLALTWTWYVLSQNPEVERRLWEELDAVLGGRMPELGDLPRLSYTRMVLEEAMRLYPPVPLFIREAVHDDAIAGYRVPAGSLVLVCQYIAHRHPAFWDNPGICDPERFSPERAAGRPRFAYFPFGGGQRTCIGNNMAMLEAQLILAAVAQRYQLVPVPGQIVEPIAEGTLRPRHGIRMMLRPRQ